MTTNKVESLKTYEKFTETFSLIFNFHTLIFMLDGQVLWAKKFLKKLNLFNGSSIPLGIWSGQPSFRVLTTSHLVHSGVEMRRSGYFLTMLASPHTHRISKSVIRMFMLSFPITQHKHCMMHNKINVLRTRVKIC